jgi:hypothetical protein
MVSAVLGVLLARHRERARRPRRPALPRLALQWIPGLRAIDDGRGWRAFGSILLPVSLLLLPRLTTLGYRLPWAYNPGSSVAWALIAAVALCYLFSRWSRRAGVS